jgi:arabinofuranosyltransferase
MPFKNTDGWHMGHFERRLPRGYLTTLRTGKNWIENQDLAEYYDVLRTVTRGELFKLSRLREVVKLNLGCYSDLLGRGVASFRSRRSGHK